MTQTNFNQSLSVGDRGEDLVARILTNRGCLVFKATPRGQRHEFDFTILCNGKFYLADVKTKARFNKFNAQGVDFNHFKKYQHYSELYGLEFYLFFVDPQLRVIHRQRLSRLEEGACINGESWPRNIKCRNGDYIRVWHINQMSRVDKNDEFSEDEGSLLTSLNQRNHEFNPKQSI